MINYETKIYHERRRRLRAILPVDNGSTDGTRRDAEPRAGAPREGADAARLILQLCSFIVFTRPRVGRRGCGRDGIVLPRGRGGSLNKQTRAHVYACVRVCVYIRHGIGTPRVHTVRRRAGDSVANPSGRAVGVRCDG